MSDDKKTSLEGPQEFSFKVEADVTDFYYEDAMEKLSEHLGLPDTHDIVKLSHAELYKAALEITVKVKATPTNDAHGIRPQDRWDVKVTWDK